MRIVQLVVEGAGFYERKSQSIDASTLRQHTVGTYHWNEGSFHRDGSIVRRRDFLRDANSFDLVHVYAGAEIPPQALRGIRRYVSRGVPAKSRFRWMAAPAPEHRIEPSDVPEAVEDDFRNAGPRAPGSHEPRRYLIGTYGPWRRDVRRICEAAFLRITRFRDDIDWDLHDEPPSVATMKQTDAWVDPATDPDDLDGMVAEAQSSGIITIASRSPVNESRLAGGSAGFLVPPDDPNELVHAVMNALFRPDLTLPKLSAVRAHEWYAPERRGEKLAVLYERMVHGAHR